MVKLHPHGWMHLFGDYDVDGTTAVAVLFLFLKKAGGRVDFTLPHRLREGYGLNLEAMKKVHASGTRMVITADCGITSAEEIRWSQEQGMDIIVTDHHEIPEVLPPALATLNPKQRDCGYPFKGLAGVGVAFNLVIALRSFLRQQGFFPSGNGPNLKEYLDLVALGTVSDVVPLTGANRILVKYGLSTGEALSRIFPMAKTAMQAGKRVQASVQSAFGCGYEGPIPADKVLAIVKAYLEAGIRVISLADTAGHANPIQVEALYAAIRQLDPAVELACHFHNTYGLGLANCYAALKSGVTSFETAFGGLGGCPFTRLPAGNVSTEDWVHTLQRMGIRLDIRLDGLLTVARQVGAYFDRDFPGFILKSGSIVQFEKPAREEAG